MPLFSVTATGTDGTVIIVGVVAADADEADAKARKLTGGGIGKVNVTQWQDDIFSVRMTVGVSQRNVDSDEDENS